MPDPFASSPEFRRLLAGDPDADLTTIAFEIALDAHPELDVTAYRRRIANLAERVRDRCPPGSRPRSVLGQINWVLFVEEGYRGNLQDYYDPDNSYLNRVIDRKVGIPISLALLYRAVAGGLGLPLSGVNLPAHFVLRADVGEAQPLFVDAFHEGALLDRKGCRARVEEVTGQDVDLEDEQLDPCSTAVVVARMLRNLKAVYLRRQEFAQALPVVRRLAALCGGDPLELRDHGMVSLRADRPGEAIRPLQAYLSAMPHAEDAQAVASFLSAARQEVARWN